MPTLCQITVVDDEQKFLEQLKKDGHAFHVRGRGWGRFTGEVPSINTSFEIHFASDPDRPPAVLRVLYHHRVFTMEPFPKDNEEIKRQLNEGGNKLELCHVFVVQVDY